jgi:8-hydroxy-5-deazaflavin:NADPH oxidoreductase
MPSLSVCNTESLGERIQRRFPDARVVKALNTLNCNLMLEPGRLKGEHDLFICGDDDEAKEQVAALLRGCGWKHIHDLGDIRGARGTEMLMPLWMRLMDELGTTEFNLHVTR